MSETVNTSYISNFLTNVIFRVDFPKLLGLGITAPPVELQEKIKDIFPILEETPGKYIEMAVPKARSGEGIKVVQEELIKWDFINKERTKTVVVTQDFISLEYSRYKSFDEFNQDIESAIRPFFDIYNVIKVVNRIGLRYINQIKIPTGDPFDWNNLINPSMCSVVREFVKGEYKKSVKRCMQSLDIKEKDSDIRLRFGLFNSEYPNKIARKEFVLDYDCYLREELDVREVFDKVKALHVNIKHWFEESIQEGLREIMRGGEVK